MSRSTIYPETAIRQKLLAIIGPTGSGKSRLSVDIANRIPSEVINADKMQFYSELRITTNHITPRDRRGVPHHLLGEFDPYRIEVSAGHFRTIAGDIIDRIHADKKLPILAGGSNSYIHALLAEQFHPGIDPFEGSDSISSDLRYDCCILWVDVEFSVLFDYLAKRLDEMLESGMLEELAEFYDSKYAEKRMGLWKAIGVSEFEQYFRRYPPKNGYNVKADAERDPERKAALEKAVAEVKKHTYELAKTQVEKIQKLRAAGWKIRRLDATEAFKEVLKPTDNGKRVWGEIWEKDVLDPGTKIVKQFLG